MYIISVLVVWREICRRSRIFSLPITKLSAALTVSRIRHDSVQNQCVWVSEGACLYVWQSVRLSEQIETNSVLFTIVRLINMVLLIEPRLLLYSC